MGSSSQKCDCGGKRGNKHFNQDRENNLKNIIYRYSMNRKSQFTDIVYDDE